VKKSSTRDLKSKIAKQVRQLAEERGDTAPIMTGIEEFRSIVASDVATPSPLRRSKPQIVLYLKEGLKGATKNWTKYPNEIHDLMSERLSEFESLLYIKLWRESWGYGRNYCRIGYNAIVKETSIKSVSTARRATAGLKEKKFIVLALDSESLPNVNKKGTLYRVCTPTEIMEGKVEEGIELADIPTDGVFCVTMVTQNTVQKGQAAMFPQTMVTQNIVALDADKNRIKIEGVPTDHGHTEHPFKEDSLKDSLSSREIISSFYKSIGQSKITKEKRERAEIVFQELVDEGFSPEDIQASAIWTIANAKEKPYDFSILKHTIGQSTEAKRKADSLEAKKLAENRRLMKEEQEKAKLEEYKSKLSEKERRALRKQAESEIRESGEYKEDFVTEQLIAFKENELLRKQGLVAK